MNPTIRETDLPGIGRKFQVETRAGDKLVIVIHDDGRRELYHFEHDDPDESISVITLTDEEARRVACIIGGMIYTPKALESVEVPLGDLVIEWLRIEPGSKACNKTIAELRVRDQTGVTILAVIDKDHKKINPDSGEVLHENSTVVIAGERDQVRALKQLLSAER